MTRPHAAPRLDVDRLRELVPVAAVLRAYGVDVQRERGRIACPLHGGHNESALSYESHVWHCHACGAGGDVYSLMMALDRIDFRAAVARVAALAGLAVGDVPRVDSAEIERQQKIARRRAALALWRSRRLSEWLTLIAALERDAERLARACMSRARDGEDPDGEGWLLLASLNRDLERAEQVVATLSGDDEQAWAELCVAEYRRQVPTPAELAP